jgi:SNF2 family DNA or RNA helicase
MLFEETQMISRDKPSSGHGYDIVLAPANQAALQALSRHDFASERAYWLRLQTERLSLIQGFDELLAPEAVTVIPFPYQLKTARTALRRFRGRGLLCDEVGLGKTIEAGLVLKEYMLRGLVRKVLIITPPALTQQWREEMASKFLITDFVTNEDPEFRELGEEAWSTFDHIIASLATARRAEHRRAIVKIHFDMVIVDEAHHLKNRATVSWKFVNGLQKKYMLMLTATPVQNNLDELYNLITILQPGQLKTKREFKRRFVVRGDPRLPKNRGELRDLLADVMVRNARSQVSIRLPRRRAHTIRLRLTSTERELYDAVSAFVREALPAAEARTGRRAGPLTRFTLQILQREIGSSPLAVRPTLEKLAAHRRLPTEQRATLLQLAEQAAAVQRQAKTEALLKLLAANKASGEKAIIFTHYLATLDHLEAAMRAAGHDLVVYKGGLTYAQKNEAIARFEQEAPFLLSTEAAGEGRNLQFCRQMINYDLPWNPMRIEQRVGRIHRIGQEREVEIFNLSAEGTIEDYILRLLDRKINMFELVIGEMDMILGNLADERDFEEIVLDIWTRARSDEEVSTGMEELGEALVKARQSYLETKAYDEVLFGQDFGVE